MVTKTENVVQSADKKSTLYSKIKHIDIPPASVCLSSPLSSHVDNAVLLHNILIFCDRKDFEYWCLLGTILEIICFVFLCLYVWNNEIIYNVYGIASTLVIIRWRFFPELNINIGCSDIRIYFLKNKLISVRCQGSIAFRFRKAVLSSGNGNLTKKPICFFLPLKCQGIF